MKKAKEYHVYIDGCSMSGSNRHGIGWVQLDNKGKFLRSHSERLPIHGATSTITEIYAAQNALSNISEGSKVVIYSDNAAVCEAIARKSFHDPQKHRKNKLSDAWQNLAKAEALHEEVAVVFTKEKDEYFMHRAHLNAQTGAMKPLKTDETYEEHQLKKHSKNTVFAELDPNDNFDYYPEHV